MQKFLLLISIIFFNSKIISKTLSCEKNKNFQVLLKKEFKYFKALNIETKDGYILKIFRVRSSKNKTGKPVILFHGLLGSSDSWILNQKSSIAKTLLIQGYDLWFVNSRGNKYSCHHKFLDNLSKKFWDFSFQEMGEFDFKAVVDHVFKERKEKIIVLGYSQGTSLVFAGLSENLKLEDKISKFLAFAPIVYFKGLKKVNSILYKFSVKNYVKILKFLRIYRIDVRNFIGKTFKRFCSIGKSFCNWLLKIANFNQKIDNMSPVSSFLKHTPSRSSTRSFEHYAQLIKNDDNKFRKFDFGKRKNLRKYKSRIPPIYDISKINIPIFIYYSDKDEISTIESVDLIKKELINAKFRFFKNFGHLNYFRGKNLERLNTFVSNDIKENFK